MKKRIFILVGFLVALVAMTLSLTMSISAHAASLVYGPYAGSSQDSGTCGNFWAQDFYNRQFTVDDSNVNPTPTHPAIVREDFLNATFQTNAGKSPGACDGGVANGTVSANVKGQFSGYELFVVTSGTLNPDGCQVQDANCNPSNTTNGVAAADFIYALYGKGKEEGAQFTVTDFSFQYTACTDRVGHWQNQQVNDVDGNTGDITGSQVACPTPTPVPPTPTPVPPTPTPSPTPKPPTPTPTPVTPTLPNTGSNPIV